MLPADHLLPKLPVEVGHVLVGDMAGGPVLGPGEVVQVTTIQDTQLRQNQVLEQAVVSGASHSLVPVELEAKNLTLASYTSKDHQLGGVDLSLIHI